MLKRILRSVTAFAAIVVAYQAYVLLAVPLMEPPIQARRPTSRPPGVDPTSANPVTKYQLLLANYFPKDHWSQTRPPKVFASSSEQAMLVLDDYTRHNEARDKNERYTQVDIARFALLVFPTPPREGITPPRDAVILEAPQGARLKFDDFRPELGRIGQITGGRFPGPMTIRSDMHEPGPEDDLLIETANMEMNTKLLYSASPVRFRLGQNVGGGRELEIRLLADEHVKPREQGMKLAGIDSLEIRRDVRMRLQLETENLLPGGAPPPAASAAEAKPSPPVEVTCSGPFTFDFVRYVASLDRDVDLRQVHPNGPSDQLACSQLDIHFAPKPLPASAPQAVIVDPGKRQQRDLGRLEPIAVVASGHPVTVYSPRENAQARGDRIQIALREQRVRVAGAHGALLVYGSNVLRAPVIDYQHPTRDSETPIGRFRATGPGTLQYVPDTAKPDQVFQATWQTLVDLGRENGQPLLTLDGRPQFSLGNSGGLTADTIKVYLRELAGEAPGGAGFTVSGADGKTVQLAPDRLFAGGNVDIQSPRLTGRAQELFVSFRVEAAATPTSGTAPPAAGASPGAAPPPSPAPDTGVANVLAGAGGGTPGQVFHVDADRMRLEVAAQGTTATPKSLACEGNVVFREVAPPNSQEQPMAVRGTQLTVDRLDTAPYVTLRGASAAGSTSAGASPFAQVSGRGVDMLVNMIEVDVNGNRMWSDGRGRATLQVTRDLQGRPSTTPIPLELTWQGRLEFDGRVVTFEREVQASGADDKLQCDRLIAKLNAPITFGAGVDQSKIDLTEIECLGRVAIDHLTRDAGGVTSHERVQLGRLSINQQTGAIAGAGPGVIRSTRFGDGLAVLTGPQNHASPQLVAPPPGAGAKLHFLRVDFQQGLTGNLYTRELNFHEQVRAVYGPVDSWEQELNGSQPETLPPEAMLLSCDAMRLNEDPGTAQSAPKLASGESRPFGFIQFRADGNVRIDGQVPAQGAFSAQADSASYEEAKDTFILEGKGRSAATLWRAGQAGAPPKAKRIRYVRSTNEVSVDGIQYLEITPQDLERAQRPGVVK